MTWSVEIRPAALEDIESAALWYDDQSAGLGGQFVREVRRTIGQLSQNPFLHPLRNRRLQARWCFPARFPYRIVYRATEPTIVVVAVLHAARHDRNWRARLTSL